MVSSYHLLKEEDGDNDDVYSVSAADAPSSLRSRSQVSQLWRYQRSGILIAVALASSLLTALLAAVFRSPSSLSISSSWKFDPRRDERNYGLTQHQCEAAFPGLFEEIETSVDKYRRAGRYISRKTLDETEWIEKTVRVLIFDRALYIVDIYNATRLGRRIHGSLHSLNRALICAPEHVPNIEFAAISDDIVDADPPYWAYARRQKSPANTWLMPDFGFYSWPAPGMSTYVSVRRKMHRIETNLITFKDKIQKALWRGNVQTNRKLRGHLLNAAENKTWSDVKGLDWGDQESMAEEFIPIEEHCKYAILIHTEGKSYSGRLKYILNCQSLIFMHPLAWVQPFQDLLVSEGPAQNHVKVKSDFSDLDEKVTYYLEHPQEATRVIQNSVKAFRDGSLTPAATACYWRRLIKGWAELSEPPHLYRKSQQRGVEFESVSLMGKLHWDPH